MRLCSAERPTAKPSASYLTLATVRAACAVVPAASPRTWIRPPANAAAPALASGLSPLGDAFGRIAEALEQREDLLAVRAVAREQRELDTCVADRDVDRLALVLDIHDVDVLVGE